MSKFAYLRNLIVNVDEIETISDGDPNAVVLTFRSGRSYVISAECSSHLLETINGEKEKQARLNAAYDKFGLPMGKLT